MSPARSDDPLRRVTLNLYEADCIVLERVLGNGWTTAVRELVKQRVNETHQVSRARTLGDLE
jgi:tRNA A37 threonylcarbamoyladenosine biosynthesis protein TsaE